MFIVTNRHVDDSARGFKKLGEEPSPKGSNELRLVEATKTAGSWSLTVLPDELDDRMKKEIGLETETAPVYASAYASRKVLERVRTGRRNLLFFVHGYNNDIKAVLERAHTLATRYSVEVLAFSWPANGGGIKGVLDYKSDKRDARASAGALDRCLLKIHEQLQSFNARRLAEIEEKARNKYKVNLEQRDQYIYEMSSRGCPFSVNMMLHSMGNYLFKQMLQSSIYHGTLPTFDNVVLAAADTNNEGHAEWVDKIRCRGRVYITINEDDSALKASRMKSGPQQLARLGHFPRALDSKQALYVDFTNAPGVGSAHAYFEGKPVQNRSAAWMFFKKAFNGERAEEDLSYDQPTGMYRLKKRR